MSLPDWLFPDDASEISHAHTFPLSPEEEEEMMKGDFFNSWFWVSDNCYADSQPYDAARNRCKKFTIHT